MKEKIYDTVSYELADVTTRFIAIFIDGIILGIFTGVFVGAGKGAGAGISFIVGVAYNWYFWTRQNGQTPGKMLMNIRVVKTDGSPITDMDAILRYVGYYINSAVLMLGWIWALADSNHQGWHDKIANTYVVKAEKRKNKNYEF
jgi:uncharacterized RDD family membrane protein YckC